MEQLVLYYSWTNTTKAVAEALGQQLQAPVVAIEEDKQRRPGIGFIIGGVQALFGWKSSIKPPDVDLNAYDKIWLGSPVWAGQPAPAVRAFVEAKAKELKGKEVQLFLTLADQRSQTAARRFSRMLTAKEAVVAGCFAVVVPMKVELGAKRAAFEVSSILESMDQSAVEGGNRQ